MSTPNEWYLKVIGEGAGQPGVLYTVVESNDQGIQYCTGIPRGNVVMYNNRRVAVEQAQKMTLTPGTYPVLLVYEESITPERFVISGEEFCNAARKWFLQNSNWIRKNKDYFQIDISLMSMSTLNYTVLHLLENGKAVSRLGLNRKMQGNISDIQQVTTALERVKKCDIYLYDIFQYERLPAAVTVKYDCLTFENNPPLRIESLEGNTLWKKQ